MHHFVTEICIHVHSSVTKWCVVGYGAGALYNMGLLHFGIENLVYTTSGVWDVVNMASKFAEMHLLLSYWSQAKTYTVGVE